MDYWLITDTHFGHLKIMTLADRPDDHEQLLFESMMSIPANDVLIHLGDIGIGSKSMIHEKFIWPVRCQKILVRGNHDHESNTWYMNHGWNFACRMLFDKLYGYNILFSHIPQQDVGYDWNIHGHFHNDVHRSHEPEMMAIRNSRQLLVSVEKTNYQAVKLEKFLNEL